ncbi:MAG TPA: tyrosine--tRNA ligase, partial [Devosia sp.]|nr:tyrosine--tRNA ligase [Devosia sp.]
LNGDLFSPYDFWQYFRNTEDADVERFLKIFTRLPLSEIAKLAALGGSELNEAKKVLATEATAVVHGRDAANDSAATARSTFETGSLDLSLPTATLSHAELNSGVGILAALVLAGLAGSNGEARRHVQSGAVRVNDALIDDDKLSLGDNALLPEGVVKLSVGKKRHALIKPV